MRLTRIAVFIAIALAVGAAAIFSATGEFGCRSVSGAGMLSLNVAKLMPGHAQTFCYTDDVGQKLRFVLARGVDGRVRSVFDACRQCFVYHRGFKIEGGDLVCRVCGNRYPIDHMTTGKASCVPVSLQHQEGAQSVQIRVSDLKAAQAWF